MGYQPFQTLGWNSNPSWWSNNTPNASCYTNHCPLISSSFDYSLDYYFHSSLCEIIFLLLFYSRAIIKNSDLLPTTPWSNVLFNDFWGTPLTHSGSHKSYRPLCVATFRINYYIGALNPFGYHLVNVLLHSAVCWLVVVLSYVFLHAHFPSLVAGLLFAVHPIHTGKI